MAANIVLNPGVGGDTVRALDRTTSKVQAVVLDLNTGGSEDINQGPLATKMAASAQADGHSATLGTTSDADTANTAIGRLKKLVGLTNGGLPAALGANGGLKVEGINTLSRVAVTPTVSTSPAYSTADQIGGVMTFASAVLANGRWAHIRKATLTNRSVLALPIELWLFQVSPTMVNSDNGAFDITDANLEAGILLGVIEFASYYNTASGQVSLGSVKGQDLGGAPVAVIAGSSTTSIYGVMVTRAGGTQAGTSDIVVSLFFDAS